MPSVAIVYHSGYGHTEKLAHAVADGARAEGAEVHVLKAADLADPDQGPWETLHAADAIVFGSPTYMGSVSGPFEAFADATSKAWFEQSWLDKLAAGFSCSSSFAGDKSTTFVRMMTLASQHGMIWVSLGLLPGRPEHPGDDPENLNRLGHAMGAGAQAGSVPPEEEPGPSDIATARHLGGRVTRLAARMAPR